jgi:hypothetical protein
MKTKTKQILLTVIVLCMTIFYHQISSLAEGDRASIASIPTGWQNIIGDRVIISLPNIYQGGKPSVALDTVKQILEETNPDAVNRLDLIQQNKDNIALFAVLPDKSSSNLNNVNITFSKANKNTTFSQYLEKTRSQLASKYQITESNLLVLPQKSLTRIIAETTIAKHKISQAIYLQETNKRLWTITYSTTSDKLESQLPTFDRSAATLQFL